MNLKEKKEVKSLKTNWPVSIEIRSPNSLVELKTFTVSDAPEIFSLIDRNREHLSRFEEDKETSRKYPNLETTVLSITKPRNSNKRRFAIRNQNGEFVGSINLTPDEDDPTSAEVGYYLGSEFTGKGYMTESVKALTDYAFSVLGCKKIYGKVVNGNENSVQVLKRCGFVEMGKTEENETVFVLV